MTTTLVPGGIPLSLFRLRTEVVYGDGCAANIGEHVVAHGRQRPLVISDPGIVAAGLLEPITSSLAAAGLAYEMYTAVEPDPRVAVVEAGLRQFQEQGCDSLIGVGGGSSMDTAKAIAIWSRNPGRLRDYEGLDQFEQPPVPLFCAPTTVGTASEVHPIPGSHRSRGAVQVHHRRADGAAPGGLSGPAACARSAGRRSRRRRGWTR